MLGPQTPYPSVSFQFYNSESIKTIHLSSSLQPSQPRGKENEPFFFNSSRSKVQLSFLNLITAFFYFLSHFFFLLMVHHVGTCPLHWKCRILATGPPGKSHPSSFSVLSYFSFLSSILVSSVLWFLPFAFPEWPFHPSLPFRLQDGQSYFVKCHKYTEWSRNRQGPFWVSSSINWDVWAK